MNKPTRFFGVTVLYLENLLKNDNSQHLLWKYIVLWLLNDEWEFFWYNKNSTLFEVFQIYDSSKNKKLPIKAIEASVYVTCNMNPFNMQILCY